jgi:hypothetical protein
VQSTLVTSDLTSRDKVIQEWQSCTIKFDKRSLVRGVEGQADNGSVSGFQALSELIQGFKGFFFAG